MKNIKITGKEIVTFLYSGGDLTNEFSSNKRALEGIEIHTLIQNSYGEKDQKEVSVETLFDYEDYSFHITGRMDGLLVEDNKQIIDEIKSTKVDLHLIKIDSRPEHLMQAKMYAYMYATQQQLKSINVQLTYVSVSDFKIKRFKKRYNISQLTKFFEETIIAYVEWLKIYENHQQQKLKSIEGLEFPFSEYREGQYKFMGAIYQSLIKEDILYSIAPTGIGKTVGSLFSALKTIKNEKEKIFYLTAKNAGKKIVVDTVNLLKEHGLVSKTVVVNSKESMCLMDKVDCDPDICPYAKGFFNRLNDALSDIFIHQDVYDMKLIKDYGVYHKICPHEFSLSISNFSDIVICDYNYAFDPRTHLIRYFDDDYYQPKLLIDEAHNMVDRSRQMYSSTLSLSTLKNLKKAVTKLKPNVKGKITQLINYINQYVDQYDIIKAQFYYQDDLDYELIKHVERIVNTIDQILSEQKKFPLRDQVLDGYFELLQFSRITDYYNSNYKYVIEVIKDDIVISLKCLDASAFIYDILSRRTFGSVFFSATLQPIDYYVTLITNKHGKSIQIPSPFQQDHLGVFVDNQTSTRYRDRDRSIERIVDNIYAMVETKIGNYIVFFPSYQYLQMVYDLFDPDGYDVYLQTRSMTYHQRQEILDAYSSVGEYSKVGFFVLGGSFSEGVDYLGDMLSGVLIVGVALPQFNQHNELLKSHFDDTFGAGFDYAYTYPGMNKVIQAVGRVIRTNNDHGIAILFDDRYTHQKYRQLFPEHWSHYQVISKKQYVQTALQRFWDNIRKDE